MAELRPLRLTPSLQVSRPDLIFYQAGVDISVADRLGHLSVSPGGLASRDRMVYAASLGMPEPRLVVTMGGGYPKDLDEGSRPFARLVEEHGGVYSRLIEAWG